VQVEQLARHLIEDLGLSEFACCPKLVDTASGVLEVRAVVGDQLRPVEVAVSGHDDLGVEPLQPIEPVDPRNHTRFVVTEDAEVTLFDQIAREQHRRRSADDDRLVASGVCAADLVQLDDRSAPEIESQRSRVEEVGANELDPVEHRCQRGDLVSEHAQEDRTFLLELCHCVSL
jgi:hypothetical protein